MKKRYKFVLIPLGVLAVLLVVAALVLDWHGRRVLAREIDAVAAEGGLRDFSSLISTEIAVADNAALLWIEARRLGWGKNGDAVDEHTEIEHKALVAPEFADPEVLRRAVASRQVAIDTAWAAAARPEVRWPIDYADPLAGMYDNYLGEARAAGRLLAADAYVAINQQDWPRAERSLLAILDLSDDVTLPPMLINTLVSIALDSLVMNLIEAGDLVPRRDLPRVVGRLIARDYRAQMRQALQGEIVFGLAFADEDDAEFSHLRRWPLRLWSHYDLAHYVRTMREISQLTERPYFEIADRLNQIDDGVRPPYLLSGILLPASHAVIQAVSVVESKRDLMLFADLILIAESQLDENTHLEWVQPSVESLTGMPLGYERMGEGGLVVWSGAAESAEISGSMRSGLVWRYKTQELPEVLLGYTEDFD